MSDLVHAAHDTALVIMARYPTPGRTKTRLARALGGLETATLYRAFLTDLAQRFSGQPSYTLHWAYTPAHVDYAGLVDTLAPEHAGTMVCFPQQGDDLAARLLHAFQWTHAQGFRRTIVISSDTPHLPSTVVADARTALDNVDVVLGPADDGGYYLIAMREPHDVFSDIPMSTDVVLRMTIASARRQGLSVDQLPALFDVDELLDLLRLGALLERDSAQAPATAAYLVTIKSAILATIQSAL